MHLTKAGFHAHSGKLHAVSQSLDNYQLTTTEILKVYDF